MSTEDQNERLAHGILKFFDASEVAEKLSDSELCAQVINTVWGQLVVGSEQSWLVDELVDRFMKCRGLDRDVEGTSCPPKAENFPMTFERRVELAAENLPEGWKIQIGMERGAAWVEATRPDGSVVHIDEQETCLNKLLEDAFDCAWFEAEADKEWVRINKLSPEQVKCELHSAGYTERYLQETIAKCQSMVDAAMARWSKMGDKS